MKDDFIDPRYEKLVALLYGELSPEEEREVRALIAADRDLNLAWEDLNAARVALREWDAAEAAPSFVFLRDEAEAKSVAADASPSAAQRPGTGEGAIERLRRGWRERTRGMALLPWATAVAAITLSLLAIGDFRVVRTPQGWKVGFGLPVQTVVVAPDAGLSASLDDRVRDAEPIEAVGTRPMPQEASADVKPVGFLTKEEFDAYAAGMTQTMVALLNNYGRQRDQEVSEVLGVALSEVVSRQTTDYRDLRGRMEALSLLFQREEQERVRSQLGPMLQADPDSAGAMEGLPVRRSED
jgi:hypothetical protein